VPNLMILGNCRGLAAVIVDVGNRSQTTLSSLAWLTWTSASVEGAGLLALESLSGPGLRARPPGPGPDALDS
jgi:hypothetical protein